MKKAILQVADQGPLESLVVMLRTAGYECARPNPWLLSYLRQFGGLVLSPEDLHRSMGYDMPFELPQASLADFELNCDLFVDVKAHQTHDRIVAACPHLKGKVLWYRINGGKPEHVVNKKQILDIDSSGSPTGKVTDVVIEDHGDEVNPPCPVLTPNQWYAKENWNPKLGITGKVEGGGPFYGGRMEWKDVSKSAYTCWPPFVRFAEYNAARCARLSSDPTSFPVCLLHNFHGWGYGRLHEPLRELGVRILGQGSPGGLVSHSKIPELLGQTLAMVHLKSSDAPGYALYEALAAACPIICTRRLIWRCRMQELLIPNETCLVFDRETHDGLTDEDVIECTREVATHLERLRDPDENRRIGENGRKRLLELQWNAERDGDSLREFMRRNFP